MTPPLRRSAEPSSEGSRAQSVYRALRAAIIGQALRPGVKLPEDAIGEQLGVSRTLVREAIRRLAMEGLAELKPNRGASVAYPSLEEARDVFEVRRALERLTMETLAGRLTKQQIADLRAHVRREEGAPGRDGPEAIQLAGDFHVRLAEMTGNPLLGRYVRELCSRCALILTIYGRPHSSDCAVSEHHGLIDALAEGDGARAAALNDQHLQAVVGRALLGPHARDQDIGAALAPYARSEGLGGS